MRKRKRRERSNIVSKMDRVVFWKGREMSKKGS
jgi:hypothetical protein